MDASSAELETLRNVYRPECQTETNWFNHTSGTCHLNCTAPLKGVLMTAQNNESLMRGNTYRATTRNGFATGEYLGMEAPHGDLAILLRHADGIHSIELEDVTAIHLLAA